MVKLFLVKESYTILRIACGRGRRPRRSPQRAKSSYIVRSARDVNKRTASCTLQNSPVDCFGRGDALQERACPSETQFHNTSILTLPVWDALNLLKKIFLVSCLQSRTAQTFGLVLPNLLYTPTIFIFKAVNKLDKSAWREYYCYRVRRN